MSETYSFVAEITKVVYENDTSDWRVLQFSTKEAIPASKYEYGNYYSTMTGKCISVTNGDKVRVVAKLVESNKWGQQFEIQSLKFEVPETPEAVLNYLSNIISFNQATTLYNAYPDIVDRVMENNNFEPDYSLVKGIGQKNWDKIRNKIITNYGYSELISMLAPVGVTLTMIKHIAQGQKNLTLLKQKIEQNPYMLCSIKGLGFKKVDNYAIKLNPALAHSAFRTTSAIRYILNDCANEEGHCYLENKDFYNKFKELIPNCSDLLKDILQEQNEKFNKNPYEAWLYVKDGKVGLMKYYHLEKQIHKKLTDLHSRKNNWNITYGDFFKRMDSVEKKQGFKLDEVQTEAVKSIADNNVTIISGKAGCGKSSILKAVLEVYQNAHIAMAALSAKAAKRIREASGFEGACTIHRLLGYNSKSSNQDVWMYNETNPLPYNLLIIDEVSMVNSELINACIQACDYDTKIILVGDQAQLPSIGVGRILGDLLEYPKFNNRTLTKIYRQSQDSFIALHANIIRDGFMPFDIDASKLHFGTDTHYIFKTDNTIIVQTIIDLYMQYLNHGLSYEDICIIIPRKEKIVVSCKTVNNELMNLLLPDETQKICYNDKEFKLGCRVINKVNDYEKGILNGDQGTITFIDNEGKNFIVTLDITGEKIPFLRSEMDNLELGYAITCHSSQGSQYKVCIIGMDFGSYTMLSSNLIYTAITRAKGKMWFVSDPKAFIMGVKNVKENQRNTFFSQFLSDAISLNNTSNDNLLDNVEIEQVDF